MPAGEERENKLLGGMLQHIMLGKETVSFQQLSKDLSFMERTTSWRDSWKILMNKKHFIEIAEGTSVFTGECRLTEAGKDHAATPEYLEYIKDLNFIPRTNDDHQARIKKRLINDKGRQIFDLLLNHGSLSRTELSTILHCNDRQHKFSYALQDLKKKNLVESVGEKKIRLSDNAFLSPGERPVTVDVDPMVLTEGARIVKNRKRSKSKAHEDEKSAKPLTNQRAKSVAGTEEHEAGEGHGRKPIKTEETTEDCEETL